MPEEEQRRPHALNTNEGIESSDIQRVLHPHSPNSKSKLIEWSRKWASREKKKTAEIPTLFQFITHQISSPKSSQKKGLEEEVVFSLGEGDEVSKEEEGEEEASPSFEDEETTSYHNDVMRGEDDVLALAEALRVPSFASLPGDAEASARAARADPRGRTVVCAPTAPLPAANARRVPPSGLVFRVGGNGDVVEAVRLSPPALSGGEDGEEEQGCVQGGGMRVIGTFALNHLQQLQVVNMACTDDARLLLIAYSDGTLVCLDVLFSGDGGGDLSIRFSQRWGMQTVDDSGSTTAVQFPTLEFLRVDQPHHFIAVAESPSSGGTRALWMDAASSPPSINLWPLAEGDVDGVVTCATARPPSEVGDDAPVAFGTNVGALGIFYASESGVQLQYVEHPFSNPHNDKGLWKVTHLHWFDPSSLAVGMCRVIVDSDCEEDREDEDDPNRHEAEFLIGVLSNQEGGAANPLDPTAWEWSELGDVVPFFSVPRGGRHTFYTAALPCSPSTMLLAGCNVASDVAVLRQEDEYGGGWEVLDLDEGRGMSCPTDEEDEFLFLMGLAVAMLPLDGMECYPFPLLASTDGSLTGFAPRHHSLGEGFFACRMIVGGDVTAEMGAPLPVSVQKAPALQKGSGGGGCILSGLDLGLDGINSGIDAGRHSLDFAGDDEDEEDSDDSAASTRSNCSEVTQENLPEMINSTSSSSAFLSGLSAPSFSFGGGSFTNTAPTKALAFGLGSTGGSSFGGQSTATTFGSTFGVTATTFGAASLQKSPASSGVLVSESFSSAGPAPVFGSGGSAGGPVFGSTATFGGGFGALASSPGRTDGFGSGAKSQDKTEEARKDFEGLPQTPQRPSAARALGSGTTFRAGIGKASNVGFGALATKASTESKGFGSGMKFQEEKEESTGKAGSPRPLLQKASGSMFGSTFGKASDVGFGTLAAKASPDAKGFGSVVELVDKKDEEKTKQRDAPQSPTALAPAVVLGAEGFGAPSATSLQDEQKETTSPKEILSGSTLTFGSGGGIPTFGFKNKGFASFGVVSGDGSSQKPSLQTNSFGAFGMAKSAFGSSNLALGMVKPLFSDKEDEVRDKPEESKPSQDDEIEPGQDEDSLRKHFLSSSAPSSTGTVSGGFSPAEENTEEPKHSQDDHDLSELPQSSSGKKAMDVFNTIFSDTDGLDPSLPSSKFESLVEEIGEGFHGEELDKQLALVDPDRSGLITSVAFVEWYCNLVNREGDESSQRSEIAEERANAEEAFDSFRKGSTQIPASDFEELLESMGTTYCEEEHRHTIRKISSTDESSGEKIITKKVFADWYVDWLFGDGESEEESLNGSDEVDGMVERESASAVRSITEGWGSMFKSSVEGSWKCGVCMVTNKLSATACAACEAPNPSAEDKSSEGSPMKPSAPQGSIMGEGGFSFGGALPSKGTSSAKTTFGSSSMGAAGAFSVGGFNIRLTEDKCGEKASESNTLEGISFTGSTGKGAPALTGIGSEGFSFGCYEEKLANTKAKEPKPGQGDDDAVKSTASGGFSFGDPTSKDTSSSTGNRSRSFPFGGLGEKPAKEKAAEPKPSQDDDNLRKLLQSSSGKKAMDVIKSIMDDTGVSESSLPSSKFEFLVEEIGEGFHGEELDKQLALVDPEGSGQISSDAFVKWYCNLVNQEGDESSQGSDIAEEKANAEEAFDSFGDGSAKILASDFGELLESMGTTYCEEEHRHTIKKISSLDESSGDKVITRKAFVDWYVDWLFGDGESEEESSNESGEGDETNEQISRKGGECTTEGWGSMFKASEEGSWKCGVCMVSNNPSATTCAACETSKPGEAVKSLENHLSKSVAPRGSSIGSSGFSFAGALPPESSGIASSSVVSSNSIGSGGFSFGGFGSAPSEKMVEGEAMKSTAPEGYSFTFSTINESVSIGIDSGGFLSGGFVSKPTEKKVDDKAPKVQRTPASAPKSPAAPKVLSTSYPPMSASAPNLFVAFAEKDGSNASGMTSTSPNNAASPPMSMSAPKPFSSLKKNEENRIAEKASALFGSAEFPPMSSAAPKNPFSTKPSSSSAAFPPMSAAAPKSISSFTKNEKSKNTESAPTSSGSAAFPPMSAAVPKPFGAFSKKEESKPREKASTSAGSAAFPPMSAAAPKNIFSTKSTPGSAFPPMSTSAPTPFGALLKKEESESTEQGSSSSGAAFPPMSAIAPKPLGAFLEKQSETSVDVTSGVTLPPMSKSAPSPFGAFSKKEDDKTAEKPPSASFPPMSAAAPKNPFSTKPVSSSTPSPFGAFSRKEESKPSEKTGAASPPISVATSKPFGAFPKQSGTAGNLSNGAAFPPISAFAPKNPFSTKSTPGSTQLFGAFSKKEESKVTEQGLSSFGSVFPSMSAAASSPFGVFSKKDEGKPAEATPVSSGAAFPPMSATAPKSFGASSKKEETKSTQKTSSSSGAAFPPMSATAPKPFGAFSKEEETKPTEDTPASSGSAFPPMSATAPKPFGAFSKKEGAKPTEKTPASSGVAFPPMPATAPTPFGAFLKKEENKLAEKTPASSGAAFFPMSATAPKPFGAFSKKEDTKSTKKTSSSIGVAFPPMSATAPKPFGAFSKKEETKPTDATPASGGAAFPPMSATAPKPFSAFSTKKETKSTQKSSSGVAFPPMSAKAPKPLFGTFSKKDERKPAEATPASSGAAFPPMSAAASQPFGVFSKKEDTKSTQKTSSSSGAALPPMSATAPKPFGAFSKKDEIKLTQKTSSSSGVAFLPMTAAAPKPFSAFSKKEETKSEKTSASSGATFPPMFSAASKPFGAFSKKEDTKSNEKTSSSSGAAFPLMSAMAPKPFGAFSNVSKNALKTLTATSSSGTSFAVQQEQPNLIFSVSSRYEGELWDQVNRFSTMTSNAKELQSEAALLCATSDLGNDIEKMANKYREKISNAGHFKDHNKAIHKRLHHLLSVQDDLDRQKKESNLAIKEQFTEQESSLNLARKEPLDAESEKMRRAIVSKCHQVQNLISTVESRLTLNKEIFSCSAGNQQDTLRASDYFNQRSQPVGRQQTTKGATHALFKSLTSAYDRVRDFSKDVDYLSDEALRLYESQDNSTQELPQSCVKRIKNKSGLRKNISPRPTSHLTSPLTNRRKPPLSSMPTSLLQRQNSLRRLAKELSGETGGGSSPKTFFLRGQMIPQGSSASLIPDWRSKGKNELYKAEQTSIVPQSLAVSPVVKTLFSSPISGTKARSDWNTTSACLRVNIPQKLRQVDVADAAKVALAKFGTTPEKLAEGRDMVSRDEAESKEPLKLPSDKRCLSNEITSSASATFGLPPRTVPPKSLPNSNAAAFPPMATRSPKPFSQTPNASVSSPPIAKPGMQVDYKIVLTKFFEENSPSKVNEVGSYLQKYKGKEADLFVALAKRYDKPNALNGEFESRVKDIDKNDYLALTSLYLKIFNPARAEVAEKLLSKNQGKEAEMFAEYSSKWRTLNPLEKPKPTKPSTASPQTKTQNLFLPRENPSTSAPAPTPFGAEKESSATSTSAPAASAFAPGATSGKNVPTASATSDSGTSANDIDYRKLLTEFYQKHNAAKMSEVANTLEKYKGRESEMFAKLAQKYKTSDPLKDKEVPPPSAATSFGFGSMSASLGSTKSPFRGGESKSPFGPSGASTSTTLSATAAPTSNMPAFGLVGKDSKSPFDTTSAAPALATSPFNTSSTSAFGTGLGSAPNPFGGACGGAAFGGAAPAPATPFSISAFGSTPAASGSPFGQAPPPAAAAGPVPSSKFGGRNPRDILVEFYQAKNPSKVNDVDMVLKKYAGKEEQLFINLAKKYNLDPTVFGVSAAQPAAAPPAAPTFGSPAAMGMGSSAGFGGGGGSSFGGSSSGAFGGFASAAQGGGFGSLASSPPAGVGFGGFGGGGGGAGAPSFGSQPFGAARR